MVQQSACATARSHVLCVDLDGFPSTRGQSSARLKDWQELYSPEIDHRHGYSRGVNPMYHPPSPPKTPAPIKCGYVAKPVISALENQSGLLQDHSSRTFSDRVSQKAARPPRGVVATGDRLSPCLSLTPPNALKAFDPNQSLGCLVGKVSHINVHPFDEATLRQQSLNNRNSPHNMITIVGTKPGYDCGHHNLKSFMGSTEEGKKAMELYIASQSRLISCGDPGDQGSVESWDVDLSSGRRVLQD